MEERMQITPEITKIITECVTNALQQIAPLMSRRRVGRPFHCTGQTFGCDTFYICDNNNHSCKTDASFGCGGTFDCTGGPFGIVIE